MVVHASGAAVWLFVFAYVAYVISVPEVGTAGDIDDWGFGVAVAVAGALWVAAAVLAVQRWREQEKIWWIPFAWWTPTLILAAIIQSSFQD